METVRKMKNYESSNQKEGEKKTLKIKYFGWTVNNSFYIGYKTGQALKRKQLHYPNWFTVPRT